MGYIPNYEESHLVVAAVRILTHQQQQPPNPEAVAEFLELSPEKVNIVITELGNRKILHVLASPFDTRVDVIDPAPLEKLPRSGSGPEIQTELEQFTEEAREKKQKIQDMFADGEMEKKRKARNAKLEEQFQAFKPKKSDLQGLFGEALDDDDSDVGADADADADAGRGGGASRSTGKEPEQ